MTRSRVFAGAVALLLLAVAVPPRAQSLADVARKEEARRKEVKDPGKVYTNKDLGSVPAPPTATQAPEAAEQPKEGAAKGTAPKAADEKDKAKEPKKDQAYWSRDQMFADSLQSRINALTTDYTARDDPAQRSVIERDRQKSLAELDRVKKQIIADKKAIDDLQEEARRAGVPPGWLRS
jgi:hypothetical protein